MSLETQKPLDRDPQQVLEERAKAKQSLFKNALLDACTAYVAAMSEYTPLTDLERENMVDSGARMAKALGDMMIPKEMMKVELQHILKDAFPIENPDLDVDKHAPMEQSPLTLSEYPIYSSSLCPHHFLPVQYTVFIAIKIPTRDGKGHVFGLSKYTRAVQTLSKRPVLQEQYTRDIVELFTDGIIGGQIDIGNEKVAGCMVIVEGEHGCMQCRGVRSQTPTTTHYARGMTNTEIQNAWEMYRGYGRNR